MRRQCRNKVYLNCGIELDMAHLKCYTCDGYGNYSVGGVKKRCPDFFLYDLIQDGKRKEEEDTSQQVRKI